MSEVGRFLSKVKILNPDQCWPWVAAIGGGGYGHWGWGYLKGYSQYPHRFAYENYFGPIPPGLQVLHRCDNRRCCNARHLFIGTNLDNVKDKVRKRRQSSQPGEEHPRSKLSEVQVRAIFADHRSQRIIAKDYGIGRIQVSRIQRREAWAHLNLDPTSRKL